MPDIQSIDVRTLLPQQPPFVMVDRILAFDGENITTSLSIEPNNLFVENNHFIEAGILEHAAQTAAVRMGYIDKYLRGGPIRLGFIGEIKKFKIHTLPQVNSTLNTRLEIIKDLGETMLASLSVADANTNKTYAEGQLKIAVGAPL